MVGMKLYLIRHGVSCANLARALSHGKPSVEQTQYIDPELTHEGEQMAKDLGPFLRKKLKKPFVAGASKLLRAQQTAYHLLHPKKLFILPHISELGRSYLESTPLESSLQEQVLLKKKGNTMLPSLRDYTYFENDTLRSEEEQPFTFLNWLALHGPTLTEQGTKALVLVSHGAFIDSFIQKTTHLVTGNPLNYELFEFDIQIKNQRAKVLQMKTVPYVDRNKLFWSTRKHSRTSRCRFPVQTRKHKRT